MSATHQPDPAKERARRVRQIERWVARGLARTWREEHFTQTEAAAQVGVSQRALSAWERANYLPQGENADRYWQFLNSIRPTSPTSKSKKNGK
jgi:DNA-binding XRE family transcriptional regulator